jgi:hypothetical protein
LWSRASRRTFFGGALAAGFSTFLKNNYAGAQPLRQEQGAVPVGLRIIHALVDAPVEPRQIVNGVMQEPTGVWAPVWYEESGRLGEAGQVLMTGVPDWWDFGPTVFYFLKYLRDGNPIEIAGDDRNLYRYRVDSVEILSPQETLQALGAEDPTQERLTLLTPTDPFDYDAGEYLNYALVRAGRTDDPPEPTDYQFGDFEFAVGCPSSTVKELAGNPWVFPEDRSGPPEQGPPNPGGLETPEQHEAALRDATPIRRAMARLIEVQLEADLGCKVAVREGLLMADGRVLALVGPPGDIPLDALTGVIDSNSAPDAPGIQLCGFFVFSTDENRWRADRFYGVY